MSRSYKKQPYPTYKKSREERQIWNRILRHNQKQKINNCLDWDGLILDVKTKINADPYIYIIYRYRYSTPAFNECEIAYQNAKLHHPSSATRTFKLDKNGHNKYCNCYSNKRSKYWKMMRK